MDIQLINNELLTDLHEKAQVNERKRINFDLRTSAEDTSQRMLNALEPGTMVPIHQHNTTTETIICVEGCLDVILYAELPNMDAGGPGHDFAEQLRISLCPREGKYGVQLPVGVWHSVEVYEPSTIFEAKDGKYGAN